MYKINTSTAVGGEFADGNPATGQKATELNASWFNTIQRELLAILTAAGVTPSISIDDQLSKVLALKSEIVWKTFLMSSAAIEVSSWTRNAVVIAGGWYDTMLYTGQTIKNSIMVVCPKWEVAGESVTSCTFTHAEDTSVPIYRGNLLFVVFDSDGLVAKSYSIPSSSDDSISILKSLIATKLNTTDLEVTGILTALSSGITLLKHLYVQKDVSVSSDFLFFSDDALTTNMGSFNHSTGLWILWQLLVVGNATISGALEVTGSVSSKNNIHPKSDTTVSTNVQTTGFITTSIIKMNADITILPDRVHNLGEHFIFVNSKIGQLLHVTYWNGVETKTSAIEMETSREFICISEAADDLILLPMDGFI